MRLALGTVQFGLDYGINNIEGKTSTKECHNILSLAKKSGISTLDTSCSYGNAESVIGNYPKVADQFQIITKTPALAEATITSQHIHLLSASLARSANLLNSPILDGVLVHQCDDLFKPGGETIYQALQHQKALGKIKKIGVSVYHKKQIEQVINHFDIDIIQLPINIFDQRLLHNGTLIKLAERNIEVHARSVFLQGLFFTEPETLPDFFNSAKKPLFALKKHAEQQGISIAELALGFIKSIPQIKEVVCGVNTQLQLQELIRAFNTKVELSNISKFSLADESILSPVNWP